MSGRSLSRGIAGGIDVACGSGVLAPSSPADSPVGALAHRGAPLGATPPPPATGPPEM